MEMTVALHHGTLVFADNENELLRALATRACAIRRRLLGDRGGLDDDLIACSITLRPTSSNPERSDVVVVERRPANASRGFASNCSEPSRTSSDSSNR